MFMTYLPENAKKSSKLEAQSQKLVEREQTTGNRMTEVPDRITEEKLRKGDGNRKAKKPGAQGPNMEERRRTTGGRMTEDGDLKTEKAGQNTRGGVQMTGESPVVSELVRDHTNPANNHRNDSTWTVTAWSFAR